MNKKKILLLACTLVTLLSTYVALMFANKSNYSVHGTEHGASCAWNHYEAVEAKTAKHGSKEFWACCTHGGYVLEEPASGTITDCGQFSGEYFDNLNDSDDRYIPKVGSVPEKAGDYVYYGIYPKKVLEDDSLVSQLNELEEPESNGWYLYEDEYYGKRIGTPTISTDGKFASGTAIVEGETYWFKCERIAWSILSITNGKYFLLSNSIVDAQQFYHSSTSEHSRSINDYPNSDVRTWLNEDFYNSAFPIGNSYIYTTTVDNSASTTDSSFNITSESTYDKVFLLSYKDYLNSSYGFSTSTNFDGKRSGEYNDWVEATGVSSWHWTRSRSNQSSDRVSYVYSGSFGSNPATVIKGVRPAINIIF